MPRINRDDLEHCTKHNYCWDCYREEGDVKALDVKALRVQLRRKLRVPCCQKHFHDYAGLRRQTNASKYARRCERKQKAGLCSHHGCRAKLIPREILPAWGRQELTCGMHGTLKAFQINRIAIIQYTIECLTPEERETGMLQNVIYKRSEGLAFIGIQYPNRYETRVGSASNLERRIKETRSERVSRPA